MEQSSAEVERLVWPVLRDKEANAAEVQRVMAVLNKSIPGSESYISRTPSCLVPLIPAYCTI